MAFDFSYPNAPANERGWGPGWPDCQRDRLVPLTVRGVSFVGGVFREVHDLAEILIEESLDRGYIPRLDDPGCWGFACRATKRSDGTFTDTPSNHSWGLAVDINAPHNVFGGSTHQIPAAMAAVWKEYGWRWLGPPIGDWMHFDFAGTPADARDMTEKARRELMQDPRLDEFFEGIEARRDGKDFNPEWSAAKTKGYRLENRVIQAATKPDPIPGPPGEKGEKGDPGDAAVLAPGTRLAVEA